LVVREVSEERVALVEQKDLREHREQEVPRVQVVLLLLLLHMQEDSLEVMWELFVIHILQMQ
jgi:hypothetical protein